jgi:hypothetical protein
MDQQIAKIMVDGFGLMGCIQAVGFTVLAVTNVISVVYLVKMHKAIEKLKTP